MIAKTLTPRHTLRAGTLVPLASVLAAALAGSPALAADAPPALATVATGLDHLPTAPGAPAGTWPGEDWWRGFGDAGLTALIEQGLAHSPTLAQADARLARAAAAAGLSRAALLPSAQAGASVGESRQSYHNGFPAAFVPHGWNDVGAVSLGLSWDLDFFGRNRAALRAALSSAEAARIEAHAARLTLASAIASAWVELARANAQRDLAAQLLTSRGVARELARHRYAEGLDPRSSLRQAEAALLSADGELAGANANVALAHDQLAELVGGGTPASAVPPDPKLPAITLTGLPPELGLDLVGRRPDLAAARARAMAAEASVTAARRAFYPDISLSALLGRQVLGLNFLTEGTSTYGQVGPALSLPLFTGGRLKAGLGSARADAAAAKADYEATLLHAVREVADAAAALESGARAANDTHAARLAADDALAAITRRFAAGLAPRSTVLAAEEAVVTASRAETDALARLATSRIALIRALGGGFAPKDTDTGNTATAKP